MLYKKKSFLSPRYTYRLLVANSLSVDKHMATTRRPTDFSDARCPHKVLPTVGGERKHNNCICVFQLKKVVANMWATE